MSMNKNKSQLEEPSEIGTKFSPSPYSPFTWKELACKILIELWRSPLFEYIEK